MQVSYWLISTLPHSSNGELYILSFQHFHTVHIKDYNFYSFFLSSIWRIKIANLSLIRVLMSLSVVISSMNIYSNLIASISIWFRIKCH